MRRRVVVRDGDRCRCYVPPRDASPFDLLSNTLGALVGGAHGGGTRPRRSRQAHALAGARARLFLAGQLGDIGLALLVLWLAAQINPGIPLFAVTFDTEPDAAGLVAAPPVHDDASTVAHENASIDRAGGRNRRSS